MLSYLRRVPYSHYDSYRGTKTGMLKNANWQSALTLQMDYSINNYVLPKSRCLSLNLFLHLQVKCVIFFIKTIILNWVTRRGWICFLLSILCRLNGLDMAETPNPPLQQRQSTWEMVHPLQYPAADKGRSLPAGSEDSVPLSWKDLLMQGICNNTACRSTA